MLLRPGCAGQWSGVDHSVVDYPGRTDEYRVKMRFTQCICMQQIELSRFAN